MVLGEGRHPCPHSFGQGLVAKIGILFPSSNRKLDWILSRIDLHCTVANIQQWTNVTGVQFVHANGLDDRVCYLFLIVGNLDHADVRGVEESVDMFLELEDS